ncbi:MAG: F0F1 ATP synthase subunit delta, partial [Candidatus Peribacteraceae bacterium]|nr:F0F1 ATP synthase subunit delta [Candidatus Peribacteraceae bacterium]
ERKNAALLGGAVLQIGDQQIDLSIRGSLNTLEMKLRGSSLVS